MTLDEEALRVVSELNTEIADSVEDPQKMGGDYQLWFSYNSDGFVSGIKFLGVWLWDSDNDGNIYDEDDKEVPLIDHIRSEARKVIGEANDILKVSESLPLFKNPTPTVDAIIMHEDGIVLIERRNEPLGWALPGGFVDEGESYEAAIAREVLEETGLHSREVKLFHVYSDPRRDPRGHNVSTVYSVTVDPGTPKAGDDAETVGVFDPDELPQMAFDHEKIINQFMQYTFFERPVPHEKFITVKPPSSR